MWKISFIRRSNSKKKNPLQKLQIRLNDQSYLQKKVKISKILGKYYELFK